MVALKVFEEDERTPPDARQRFLREARLLASLEHPHPDDERLYGSFKALAAVEDAQERLEAFEAMNRIWISVQHQHRIFQNLIAHVIDDLGRGEDEVAFLNTFPLRCQENQGITLSMRKAARRLAVERQLDLLAPGRLLCLGAASAEVMERFYTGRAKRFRFPRSRGDQTLTRDARAELARLRADRL